MPHLQRTPRSTFWRRCLAAGAAATLVVLSGAPLRAQQALPEAADAAPAVTDKWVRVIEEDDGEIIKLQLVSREYRLADGAGPGVFLTGAVNVADASFYSKLQSFLDAKDVVLYEGVMPPGAGRLAHHERDDDEHRAQATKRRIRLVATFVEKYRKTHKSYPDSLEQLADGLDGRIARILQGCTRDAWGNALLFTSKEPPADATRRAAHGSHHFEITSLGADARPEGEGVNADIAFSDQPAISRDELAEGEGIQRQLASALRLQFQLDAMDDTRPNWRNSDLSVDQVMDRLEAAGADTGGVFSLMGGGSLLDSVIGAVARLVGMSKTLSTMLKMGMVDMLSHADQLIAGLGGEMGAFMSVIIEERNKVVIDDVAKILKNEPEIKSIGIIYGAGHLPDLHTRLTTELNLEPVGETWFTAITVKVADAGMTPEEARETRDMINTQIKRQLKAMQRGR